MIAASRAKAAFSRWEGLDILGVAALAGAAAAPARHHSAARPADLSRVSMAFSTRNGWSSVLPLIETSIDLLWFKAH